MIQSSGEKSILIAGAGNIGRRHFESLLNYEDSLKISLLDPSEKALEYSREIPAVEISSKSINYFKHISKLNSHYDLVIICTNSDVRLSVLEELLNFCSFSKLILEKFLFQSAENYKQASRILKIHKINTWVNCSRRDWKLYKFLKKELEGQGVIDMSVFGNNWGMACNAIHFIDLFAWLNNVEEITFNTDRIEDKIYEAKRKGYKEFFGTMEGDAKSSRVQLTCLSHGEKEFQITLKTKETTVVINEKKGWAVFSGDTIEYKSYLHCFKAPKTSEITKSIVRDILNNRQSNLPSFNDSARLHLSFLESLIIKAKRIEGVDRNGLAIT